MALRGTLKDFGIADIFQLIGHQAKSGHLEVKHRGHTVKVAFADGHIVKASASGRKERDMLGSMLVRAEVVSEAQLAAALTLQQSAKKRLGEVLVETTNLDAETLELFMRLQTTETIYRLFVWDQGTYEFTSSTTPVIGNIDPIRSDTLLMEGFRQVDEWPVIRRSLAGYGTRLRVVEDLEQIMAAAEDAAMEADGGDPDSLDFGESPAGGDPRLRKIGDTERFIYSLINDHRDVQKIIDLSRLGEFEACKALVNLIEATIIETGSDVRESTEQAFVGGITSAQPAWMGMAVRVVVVSALVAGAGYLLAEAEQVASGGAEGIHRYVDVSLQRLVSRGHVTRLEHALRLYRAETGEYPESLEGLVERGLLTEPELRYPWSQNYRYGRTPTGYRLAQPLF